MAAAWMIALKRDGNGGSRVILDIAVCTHKLEIETLQRIRQFRVPSKRAKLEER